MTWRLPDENKWVAIEHEGATVRHAMPPEDLTCYGCGRVEGDDVSFGAMIPMRHVDTGERWVLFLCDDCWANAALEHDRLSDLWDTIPEPA